MRHHFAGFGGHDSCEINLPYTLLNLERRHVLLNYHYIPNT